jgi:hypothetical protein
MKNPTVCSITDCDLPVAARGMCPKHYARVKKYGDPNVKRNRWTDHERKLNVCSVPGCGRTQYKHLMCSTHRGRYYRSGDANVVLTYGRQYQFREDLLDTWTRESAYALGWALTDGGIYDGPGGICLKFELKDEEAIRILMSIFRHPREPVSSRGYFRVVFSSRHLVDRLHALGIGPRKSLTVAMPPVPDEYLSHFVRGVVEGDGSITPPGYYFRAMINSASPEFIPGLLARLPFKGSLFSCGVETRKNPLMRIVFSGREAMRFCEWMYADSEGLRLTRKYRRYVESTAKNPTESRGPGGPYLPGITP